MVSSTMPARHGAESALTTAVENREPQVSHLEAGQRFGIVVHLAGLHDSIDDQRVPGRATSRS